MDNNEFIEQLAGRLGCDTSQATGMVDAFTAIIREECADTNRVAIPGFGSFDGLKHDEEIVADLTTGKRMLLPPSIELTFTAGGMLKKKLKEASR